LVRVIFTDLISLKTEDGTFASTKSQQIAAEKNRLRICFNEAVADCRGKANGAMRFSSAV